MFPSTTHTVVVLGHFECWSFTYETIICIQASGKACDNSLDFCIELDVLAEKGVRSVACADYGSAILMDAEYFAHCGRAR